MSEPKVELRGLAKRYGEALAVDDLNLAVARGEMLALLGPSGCGKTTALRMIAGFVQPSGGRILVDGADITDHPPYRRDASMVFQSYALFPHMTVAENIGFGLRRRRVPAAALAERVRDMMAMLKLDSLADRLPRQLSGGQQQRVALGRALVVSPAVLLLDEPFSNLDAQLRASTSVETRRIQKDIGITSLLVTHDQAEAMAIADRVAVMNAGRVVQVGSPHELYSRPNCPFVATFLGRANVLDATALSTAGGSTLMRAEDGFDIEVLGALNGARQVVLRPEAISIAPDATGPNTTACTVDVASFLGSVVHLELRTPSGRILLANVQAAGAPPVREGETVHIRWDASALWVIPPAGAA